MPSNLQLYFKEHHHRWFSVNTIMSKYSFIALFHANMRSHMFYKIDVSENSSKFTGNRLYQTLVNPTLDNFLKFLGTPFLRNTSERLLLISVSSFYCFKMFLFQCFNVFVILRSIFVYYSELF